MNVSPIYFPFSFFFFWLRIIFVLILFLWRQSVLAVAAPDTGDRTRSKPSDWSALSVRRPPCRTQETGSRVFQSRRSCRIFIGRGAEPPGGHKAYRWREAGVSRPSDVVENGGVLHDVRCLPPPPETERRPTDEQRRKPIERRNGLSLGRRDGGALRRPEPNRVSTQCVRVCARTGAMAGNTVRSRFPTVLVLLTLVSCTWAAFASADSADGCDWTGRSVFFLSLMRHMAPRVSHEKRPPSVALAKSDWCAFSSTKMAALQNWQSMLSAVSRSLESVPISFPESIQSLMGRRWPTEPNSAITSQHGRVWP